MKRSGSIRGPGSLRCRCQKVRQVRSRDGDGSRNGWAGDLFAPPFFLEGREGGGGGLVPFKTREAKKTKGGRVFLFRGRAEIVKTKDWEGCSCFQALVREQPGLRGARAAEGTRGPAGLESSCNQPGLARWRLAGEDPSLFASF